MRLVGRIKRLERGHGLDRCSACGPDRFWLVDASDHEAFLKAARELDMVCERCGRDWRNRGKIIAKRAWDAV